VIPNARGRRLQVLTVWHEVDPVVPPEERYFVPRYPHGYVVRLPDLPCDGSSTEFCHASATRWEGGRYYCDRHWITEDEAGSSPRDRAWTVVEGRA
jgi:hypothetical protein